MRLPRAALYLAGLLWGMAPKPCSLALPDAPSGLTPGPGSRPGSSSLGPGVPRQRRKRHISARDVIALLNFHNRVRAGVFPPAANMEYMVWDEQLAKVAEAWATQCIWDHGPPQLMRHVGQNLSFHSGRFRSVVDLVKSWSDEKKHYSFPWPRDCKPSCPSQCTGHVCTHYTQMVWASSNRLGCALHTCTNMNIWGNNRRRAVYLVCNYAIKGNWIGEAPYKVGRPCSACPSKYGGRCKSNMCSVDLKSKLDSPSSKFFRAPGGSDHR
ncbi:peptidase inhibitor R3HDML [Ornithorhynchus anatinus]|uniref:R3H domain containing like n=1 Tax=Ornithorhynchus anatinus TaxID=9258 RepID=F6UAZ5_ORNAN|nr:peptidase inhibitor R3HDML [Ornithorhynchus anatinus]